VHVGQGWLSGNDTGQTLVLLIIAGISGLIGWLIGRPKGRPGWRNLMTYGNVHPRSATLMASGKGGSSP
jgi:hypothetical protein